MTDERELPPFRPPYVLGGSCLVLVGWWEQGAQPLPPEYRAVRWRGRPMAVVVATHYRDPPAEMPIRYREVIAASIVRRGLTFASVPRDMVLDQPLPVDLGRLHYGLPKRLDPSLEVVERDASFTARARDLVLEARGHGSIASACALPLRLAFGLAVRAVTASTDVLGLAYPPARRARIALEPRGLGRSMSVEVCSSGGIAIRSFWCQSWDWTLTHLGAPLALEGHAAAALVEHLPHDRDKTKNGDAP